MRGLIFEVIRKEAVFNRKFFEVFYPRSSLSKHFRREEKKITA